MKYIFFLTMAISNISYAGLTVIADFGGRETGITTPQEFFELNGQSLVPAIPSTPPSIQRFPIRSSLMPGEVENSLHNHKVLIPFFIIGTDQSSLEWLVANADYFKQIRATGMVTNVENRNILDQVRNLVPELRLEAIPVDVLAQSFGLTHYPVLIDKEGIKQ